MVHLKKEKKTKVVLSYISNAYILLLAYPFHFIDLSAQNAINHFNKATVWRFDVSQFRYEMWFSQFESYFTLSVLGARKSYIRLFSMQYLVWFYKCVCKWHQNVSWGFYLSLNKYQIKNTNGGSTQMEQRKEKRQGPNVN